MILFGLVILLQVVAFGIYIATSRASSKHHVTVPIGKESGSGFSHGRIPVRSFIPPQTHWR